MHRRTSLFLLSLTLLALLPLAAGAAEPMPWQIGLQPPATPIAERIHDFHLLLMVLMSAVVVVVLALLLYVAVRFRKAANPTPARFTHNTMLEVIWTGIPVVILLVIAAWSFPLIYYVDRGMEPELTIKATGYQWYWGYDYPDKEIEQFTAYPIADADIGEGQKRQLSTDNVIVVPANTVVEMQITAGDVLHAWTIPAFAVKKDAVPGRLNAVWFRVEQEGVYYGQCSELCGTGHGYMPIELHVVAQDQFDRWVELAKTDIEQATSYAREIQAQNARIALASR